MKPRARFEIPPERQGALRRAARLEWATLFFMSTIVLVIYVTMGSSQAMKAAWVEDMLSFVPPIAYLVASRYRNRAPTADFPYGYHRAVSIAFLAGAVSLTLFGGFILIDSVLGLVRREHPTIGLRVVFGREVWAGWLMVGALAYSAIPPLVLGRMKLGPARELHDKTLRADADMNKADWMTAGAGIAGVLGVGLGWWWADSVAAGLISFDIVNDGVQNLRRVVADLMDQRPTTIEGERSDVPERVRSALLRLPWVRRAQVRLREEGHVFAGEVFLAPVEGTTDFAARFEEARRIASDVDWRVHDLVFTLEPEEAE
ncbi:MAG: cation diffusion facilitator family transporter [Longimicrobiales bacterium]